MERVRRQTSTSSCGAAQQARSGGLPFVAVVQTASATALAFGLATTVATGHATTQFVIDLLHRARGVSGVVLSKPLEGVLPCRRNITAEQLVVDEGGRPPQVVFELSE